MLQAIHWTACERRDLFQQYTSWESCYFATTTTSLFNLQVYDGADTSANSLATIDGYLSEELLLRSSGKHLLLHMTSDFSGRRKGFYAVYNASKSVNFAELKFWNNGFAWYCTQSNLFYSYPVTWCFKQSVCSLLVQYCHLHTLFVSYCRLYTSDDHPSQCICIHAYVYYLEYFIWEDKHVNKLPLAVTSLLI